MSRNMPTTDRHARLEALVHRGKSGSWACVFILRVIPYRVSVRPLHQVRVVQNRGMWGSFVAWRISDEFETFREHGPPILLGCSYRGLASKRAGPDKLLPPAWTLEVHVRSLAEVSGRQGSGA